VIRRAIDPLHVYVMMVALSYFHRSNAHTLSAIFRTDLWLAPELAAAAPPTRARRHAAGLSNRRRRRARAPAHGHGK